MQMKLASPHAQILLLKVIILSSSKSVHNSSDGSKNQITCFCAVSAAGETIPLINAYLQRYEKLCARSIIGSLLNFFWWLWIIFLRSYNLSSGVISWWTIPPMTRKFKKYAEKTIIYLLPLASTSFSWLEEGYDLSICQVKISDSVEKQLLPLITCHKYNYA